MATLPLDILFDMLRFVGVKDLVRFRCVSKSWCSLIDDPDFIKHHLSHSLETNRNRSLVIRSFSYIYSVNLDSLKTAQKLNPPFINRYMLASCHGLLLVFLNDVDLFCLWNPSTRKHQTLPCTRFVLLELPCYCSRVIRYGFGYDPSSDDYKLVLMVQLYHCFHGLKSEVKVYSLRTNSWRRIKELPFFLKDIYGVFTNNALHWVVSKKHEWYNQAYVVAFDLGTEEYRFVELPDCLDKVTYFDMKVKVMGSCLCLIRKDWEVNVVEIWMMKEYGVKESWTKLMSLNQFQCVSPLAFSENGDKVLLNVVNNINRDPKDFVRYDLKSKVVENLEIEGTPDSCQLVEVFVESLVSPMIK